MKGNTAATILRWGLAFVFFYAAISSLRDPDSWIGFIPTFLTGIFPAHLMLTLISIYQLALAVWLFIGKKLIWSSALSTITLIGITVFNFDLFIVTFRDVGLAMASLALFELAKKHTSTEGGIS